MIARRDRRRAAPIWRALALGLCVAVVGASSALAVHGHAADDAHEPSLVVVAGHGALGSDGDHAAAPCSMCSVGLRDGLVDSAAVFRGAPGEVPRFAPVEPPSVRPRGPIRVASPRAPPTA